MAFGETGALLTNGNLAKLPVFNACTALAVCLRLKVSHNISCGFSSTVVLYETFENHPCFIRVISSVRSRNWAICEKISDLRNEERQKDLSIRKL